MRAIATATATAFLFLATLASGPVGAMAGLAALALCAVLP